MSRRGSLKLRSGLSSVKWQLSGGFTRFFPSCHGNVFRRGIAGTGGGILFGLTIRRNDQSV